jgi:NAD(P)H-dependent FMN reductase
MINFSVSTTLKSWFDYVARAGRTFSYSETGPKGLVNGKRVIVVSASGGIYSGENAAFDFQVPWLRNMLGFLGMTDVEVIRIEGTALGPEAADKALGRAAAHARDFVGALAAACRRSESQKAISAFPRASPVLPPARVTRQLGQHQCKTDGCCAEATQTN